MNIDFVLPLEAPQGFHYEYESNFRRNLVRIWIVNEQPFLYKNGEPASSVWGFYNVKTKKYFSPKNAKTVGKEVDISDTTPYSAMTLNLNPLQMAFR